MGIAFWNFYMANDFHDMFIKCVSEEFMYVHVVYSALVYAVFLFFRDLET